MGVGDSLEAAWTLKGPIPAGTWHLVGDGIVLGEGALQVDVRYEILWRAAADAGSGARTVVSFDHHLVRPAGASAAAFGALPCAGDAEAAAVPAQAGDQLVMRITATAGDPGVLFVPNGDGATKGASIPHVDLPR